MKLLIDTNVILDIALNRKPFVKHATKLFKVAHKKNFLLYISATTVTDIYYITRKECGKDMALTFLKDLSQFINIISVNKQIILQSINSDMPDFEDAIQVFSAKQETISTIITRNEADFIHSGLTIYNPECFLTSL